MRLYQILIATTALSTGLATASFGATIPVGTSTGAAVYNPTNLNPADGCPCGAEIRVGQGSDGTWTLNSGQTFSIGQAVSNDPNAGPYVVIGRGNSGSHGTVTVTGPGAQLNMTADNNGATVQIGRQFGTGTLNVNNGGTFSVYDPNSGTVDNDNAIHLGESGGTGTLTVDHGTVSVQTGNGATLYVGADNSSGDANVAGTGIANVTNNSSLVLRDLVNNTPDDHEIGAQIELGQGDNTSGTMTVDHSTVTVDGQDSYAGIEVGGHPGTTTGMTITNSSSVNVTANSAGTAKGANEIAELRVGKRSGTHATLNIDGNSDITLTGPFVDIGIGDREGANGEMNMSGGSTLSDGGSAGNVQIGQWDPTGNDGGIGKLTVSGAGTKFDVSNAIDVGQGIGAGSSQGILKVENSGEVTAGSVNLYKGGTLMGNGGTINANVNLKGGTIAPGASPGTMTINGNLTPTAGTLEIQIAGTNAADYDHLIINGDLNAATPLNVHLSFLNSFQLHLGDTFSFLQVLGLINAPGSPFNVFADGYASGDFAIASSGGTFSLTTIALTATTPIPAALPLFASALGGLGFVGWRRRRRQSREGVEHGRQNAHARWKAGDLIAATFALALFIGIGGRSGQAAPVLLDHTDSTVDTITHLEWLDLTKTAGLSYDDVINNNGVNYIADHWRYATGAEVAKLFTDAGGSGVYPEYTVSAVQNSTYLVARQLLSLMGVLSVFGSPQMTDFEALGITAEQPSPGQHFDAAMAYAQYTDGSEYIGLLGLQNGLFTNSHKFSGQASFLVRNVAPIAPTPIPAALPLFISALGGLGFVGWRRRRADGNQI